MKNKTEEPLPRRVLRKIPEGYAELRQQYQELYKDLTASYTYSDNLWSHTQHVEVLLREMTEARDLWMKEYQHLYDLHRYIEPQEEVIHNTDLAEDGTLEESNIDS